MKIEEMRAELINMGMVNAPYLKDKDVEKAFETMVGFEKKEEETMSREEAIKRMVQLARSYDLYTQYIENYKQMKSAEKANEEIDKEWKSICKQFGIDACILNYANLGTDTEQSIVALFGSTDVEETNDENENKEEETMEMQIMRNELLTNKAMVSVLKKLGIELTEEKILSLTDTEMKQMYASATKYWGEEIDRAKTTTTQVKEDTTMTQETITTANNESKKEDTIMMNRTDDLNEVLAALEAKKTSDPAYLDKNAIAKILKKLGVELSKREVKNTKRDALVEKLVSLINEKLNPQITEADPVPVGDLNITYDNAPANMDELKEEETMKKTTITTPVVPATPVAIAMPVAPAVVATVNEEPVQVSNDPVEVTSTVGPNTHSAYKMLTYKNGKTPENLTVEDKKAMLIDLRKEINSQINYNWEKKEGQYGHVISDFMLNAVIAKALFGIKSYTKVKESDAKHEAKWELDKVILTPAHHDKIAEFYKYITEKWLEVVTFTGDVNGKTIKFVKVDEINGKKVSRYDGTAEYSFVAYNGQKGKNWKPMTWRIKASLCK